MSETLKNAERYENGIQKRLCANCEHCGRRCYCSISRDLMGLDLASEKFHPCCPLKALTIDKLKTIAKKKNYKSGWVYYTAKNYGLKI